MTLRLKTFGSVALERDRAPLGGAHTQRRRLALLTYLASADDAPVSRDKLLALLWPERDQDRGRHSLSQLVYAVRHDLHPELLVAGPDDVRLNRSLLCADVFEFAECVRRGELERAAELYRGPFLDGFFLDDAPEFERWADAERTRLHACAGRILERLADRSEREREEFAAADWWRRRVALDPTDTRVVLRLMRALVAVGDRNGALAEARVHAARVRELLEVEPDPAVARLAQEIERASESEPIPATRAVERAPAGEVGLAAAPPRDPTPAAPKVSGRWRAVPRVGGVVVALSLLVIAGVTLTRPSGPAGGRAHTVLLGDLDGPDSLLTLAVREALRAELANLEGVMLVSDPRVRALKTLMRAPLQARLSGPVLLEVAQRAGASAAITGSVRPLGLGATFSVQVLDPETGDQIGGAGDRPGTTEDLVTSVARVGRSLRKVLTGLGPDTVTRPLPSVTTSSLTALSHYTLARRAAGDGDRFEAIGLAELALQHDTAFALAHYLAGDLLWFLNQQTHADSHLTRAVELGGRLPVRERLVVQARYEQLVRDRPDSALAYWELLRRVAPGEALAYEGMSWTLRALGRYEEAAAAADTAMTLEPTVLLPSLTNAIYALLSVGDTAGALAAAERGARSGLGRFRHEARFYAALMRLDTTAALAQCDSVGDGMGRARWRHQILLAAGRFEEAARQLDTIAIFQKAAESHDLPRAMLLQGLTESRAGRQSPEAAGYARAVLELVQRRDLSPPAVARMAERIGDLAARVGDSATVKAVLALVDQRDHGRGLPSYEIARHTLAAALAYVRRDYAAAAKLAARARVGVYFSRSLNTVMVLEADARRAAGDSAGAAALYHLVGGERIADGDFETWMVLRRLVRRELAATSVTPRATPPPAR